MTRDDLRVLCTMLGFVAVTMKDEDADNQAPRVTNFARLIESFCLNAEPAALGVTSPAIGGEHDFDDLDWAIDRYKAALVDDGEARLPDSRDELLRFYDRLLTRKTRRDQRAFYASANDDMIANRILRLVDEEIERDELEAGGTDDDGSARG